MRVIGDNSDGFQNEKEIMTALNAKRYDDINANLRHFLDDIFRGSDLKGRWVHAHTFPQRMKPDFYVTIDGIPTGKYISVKKGSGNSLHQEPLKDFTTFLKENNISDNIINELKEYHYSDGTFDNTGAVRYDSKEYSKMHPDLVKDLNKKLNKKDILKKIITRVIFKGNYPDAPEAEYVYHGTCDNGVWASKKEIFDYIDSKTFNKDCVAFGPLTYQAWNKNLNRNPNAEKKREQIQIKWGTLENSLTEITSRRDDYQITENYRGTMSEKASVIYFNKNPQAQIFSDYLKSLRKKPENTLLIRVTTKQLSTLSNQKVNTRADAYAIEILDNKIYDVLEENNYYLDEDILRGYDEYYNCIDESGISIKKDDSENFTIIKFTPDSFYKIFGSYELGYGASVFCKKTSELPYNVALLKGWKTDVDALKEYFDSEDISLETLTESLELCKKMKDISTARIKETIDASPRLQHMIFNGKDIYEEPYPAYFFMQNNQLRVLDYIPFNVTTGSGRSHGDYSIVLKPRAFS